ncbi:tripartite tricarboxylate transporter TctB family protein [Bacillus thermotolerans]|uniref:Tricarboxylate transport protein TctB n=1 Tax=Bacillus thermotolerans TaxID=1221996 RepID=A0A0F5HT24_BACTR|nr:tripartite tricarboxylate transporter TctB family protein [Bacillus thermotolerans]KKB36165.1 Tricarboxylate transport protein TctB [Bacillus thermotolerans]KKB41210.1 Tricarboxylate transport protein TctB [Bacillus thermotolerans]KKB44072.1 Tricarboxylate transport protein TctB [Bacillus thermotolerans]
MANKPSRWIALLLLAIAGVYLVLAYQLPEFPYAIIDSDVLPKGLGFLLIILSVVLFATAKEETAEEKEKRTIPKNDLVILLITAVAIFIYISLLEVLGFLLTTILFLLFLPTVLGYRKYGVTVAVAFIFSGVMYYSFTYLLNITLPQGIMPF